MSNVVNMDKNKKDPKNVFVVAHKGSLRALMDWITTRESFNAYSDHYIDTNGNPFIGLAFVNKTERIKRGVIVVKDKNLMTATKKIIDDHLEANNIQRET